MSVIIVSGHGDIEACRRAFKNGAVDFLSKPIHEQDLIDAAQKAEKLLSQFAVRDAESAEARALLAQPQALSEFQRGGVGIPTGFQGSDPRCNRSAQ